MPVELAQYAEQGVSADHRPESGGRLAVLPDRRVQRGPHGRQGLGEAQPPEPLLGSIGQRSIGTNGVGLPFHAQLAEYAGEFGPRHHLGRLREPGQVIGRRLVGRAAERLGDALAQIVIHQGLDLILGRSTDHGPVRRAGRENGYDRDRRAVVRADDADRRGPRREWPR